MLKRLVTGLIPAAMSAPILCAPFLTTDPTSLSMGGAGTAGGRLTSGPYYNPAILSFDAKPSDDFIFSLQLGAIVADEDESRKTIEDLTDDDQVENFDNDLDTLNTSTDTLTTNITSLVNALGSLNSGSNYSATPISTARSVQTSATDFESTVTQADAALTAIENSSNKVLSTFEELDNNSVRGVIELGVNTLFPDERLAVGLSIGARAFLTGQLYVSDEDLGVLRNYLNAARAYTNQVEAASDAATNLANSLDCRANGTNTCTAAQALEITSDVAEVTQEGNALQTFSYGGTSTPEQDGDTVIFQNGQFVDTAEDPTLNSSFRAIGVGISELGITLSRPVNIDGRTYHIGITPKYQVLSIFDYTFDLDSSEDFDFDDVRDTEESYSSVNLDIGVIHALGYDNEFVVGFTIHDIVPNNFESKSGYKVKLSPALRVGAAYVQDWYRFLVDLDITRNQPVGVESRTQYLSFGAEIDFWDIFHFRAGYRTNIAKSGQGVVSAGFGITPYFDIAALANPATIEQELGVSARFGFGF